MPELAHYSCLFHINIAREMMFSLTPIVDDTLIFFLVDKKCRKQACSLSGKPSLAEHMN